MEKQTTHMERAWETFAWIYQKRIRERDLWSTCLRVATLAGLELWGSRRDQIPSMRPIAWKESMASTGSVVGIWDVRVAYFSLSLSLSLSLHLNLSFVRCQKFVFKNLPYPFKMVTYRSGRRQLLRAFPFGHVAMCAFLLRMHNA